MTTTRRTKKPAALPLPDPQIRRLLDVGRVTVVVPLREQPPEDVGTIHTGTYHPTVVGKNGQTTPGQAVFGVWSEDDEWGDESPYQPGDRVEPDDGWWLKINDTRMTAEVDD